MSKSLSFRAHWFSPVLILLVAGAVSYGQELPRSLYADRKARGAGDVVTILVAETANASRQSKVQKAGDNSVDAEGSVQGNLLQFLPIFGLKSRLKTGSNSSEGTAQKDLLTGRISPGSPSGTLLINSSSGTLASPAITASTQSNRDSISSA